MIKTGINEKVGTPEDRRSEIGSTAIEYLKFPFDLKIDQIEAVEAWISNDFRGSIVYSTGTGKTEIAFECARRAARVKRGAVSDGTINTNFKHNTFDDDLEQNNLGDTDSIIPNTGNFRPSIEHGSDRFRSKSKLEFKILVLVPAKETAVTCVR